MFNSNTLLGALATGIIAVAVLASAPLTRAEAQAQNKNLIELFTSQGCSSCPPADRLIPSYARRNDVIPLTYNVDYWDYLGWKDTLAKNAFTQRQRRYASVRGDGEVYTPQTVINGLTHAVGSRKSNIDKAISYTASRLKYHAPTVSLVKSGERLQIKLGDKQPTSKFGSATVWMARVTPRVDVAIKRGENHGRKITYYNVVRELRPVGMWDGKSKTITLPAKHFLKGNQNCVVFLQSGDHGPILGAAEFKNPVGT